MTVKGNHPLAEIIARKLFCIESVPVAEQGKMVNRAIKAAVAYHEAEINRKDKAINRFLNATHCLDCHDIGWYIGTHIGLDGEPEAIQVQCEFCLTEENSVYRRKEELQQALSTKEKRT